MNFGLRLKELRLAKHMTQEDLGKVMNVSKASISLYEKNERTPDQGTLIKTADFFGVTVDYLLGINNTPEWATEKQVTDLKEWLNDPDANAGLSFGGAELTKEEKEKLKLSVTQIFWDRLKLERMPMPDARYMRKDGDDKK